MMRAAYAAFQEGSEPQRILAAVDPMRGSRDTFYANLVSPLACADARLFQLCLHAAGCRHELIILALHRMCVP